VLEHDAEAGRLLRLQIAWLFNLVISAQMCASKDLL
jgi:hypothetical protein